MTRHMVLRTAARARRALLAGAAALLLLWPVNAAAAETLAGSSQQSGTRPIHHVHNDRWGGYLALGPGTFSAVRASWTVPSVRCDTGQVVVFWVGEGVLGNYIEQAGTGADCTDRGRPQYFAWYESFPAKSVRLTPEQMRVSPGDSVSVKVAQDEANPSRYHFTLENHETDQSFRTTAPAPATNPPPPSFAAWIVERPLICPSSDPHCTVPVPADLADFHSVRFRGASATSGGVAGAIVDPRWTTLQVTMQTQYGPVLAVPGPLGDDNRSFTVRRTPSPPDGRDHDQVSRDG